MKFKKHKGPISRNATLAKYSHCCSADLAWLDWKNWFQDCGYIHVRRWTLEEGETWHRVRPKRIGGRVANRMSVKDGLPHWLFDVP